MTADRSMRDTVTDLRDYLQWVARHPTAQCQAAAFDLDAALEAGLLDEGLAYDAIFLDDHGDDVEVHGWETSETARLGQHVVSWVQRLRAEFDELVEIYLADRDG